MPRYAHAIFPKLDLLVSATTFTCPYCEHAWARSFNDGAIRAGVTTHIRACWEIGLYLRGYALDLQNTKGWLAVPLTAMRKSRIESIKRTVRKRSREGVLEKLKP